MTESDLTAIFRASVKTDAFPYADVPRAIAKLARFSSPAKHAPTELDRL